MIVLEKVINSIPKKENNESLPIQLPNGQRKQSPYRMQ